MREVEAALDARLVAFMASLHRLLRSDSLSFAHADIPPRPGIYVIYDGSERPYYVGQSRNLRRRLLVDHRRGNGKANIFRRKLAMLERLEGEPAVTLYITERCSIRFMEVDSDGERLEMEHFATALLSPVLNTRAS
ncbi:MAG: GIY-YIG nuclease family protein [Dehalococcoidia bacterium]